MHHSDLEEMEEKIIINTTSDPILQLPESIVHHILSFLYSPSHLVRMSVLSRSWFALTASFPILDFDIYKFVPAIVASDMQSVSDMFFKYMNYTMSRFCEQNISALAFKLSAIPRKPREVEIIDRCVRLILKKGVQVLEINVSMRLLEPLQRYRVPNVLLSTSSLRSLRLDDCDLSSSLMVNAVKFTYLKQLKLWDVLIDEEAIKHLTTSCPLLEEIFVSDCYGFKTFGVYGLQNLREVRINFQSEVERIDIEAPNLRGLCLMDCEARGAPSMNLVSCKKLTLFSYIGGSRNSEGFIDFLSNSVFIKNLFLQLPNNFNNLELSSDSFIKFEIDSWKKFEIDIPILFLYYNDKLKTAAPMVRVSAPSRTQMDCYPIDAVDIIWFQKLRRFLDETIRFNVLTLHISSNFIDFEELKVIQSPPYNLKHVGLQLETIEELSAYVAVVEAVLWCCRPRSLTLSSSFRCIDFVERSHVVKVTYMKLAQQEDEGQSNIQIVMSPSSKDKKHFSDLNSLLTALPLVQQSLIINFKKV